MRDPKDRVRLEIEAALEYGLVMVPVPLDNTPQPVMQDLPQSLSDFLRQPAVRLDPSNIQNGLAELTQRLETGLALQHVIRTSTLKRGSIHHRDLPEEDLLGFTDENRPEDIFGIEHSTLTDIRRAIDYQETALNLARESKDQEAESRALGKLGLAFGKMGESNRAINYFEKQLRILKELGKREELGDLLANLGDASAVQLDFVRAVSYYNEQLGLALELGHDPCGKLLEAGSAGVVFDLVWGRSAGVGFKLVGGGLGERTFWGKILFRPTRPALIMFACRSRLHGNRWFPKGYIRFMWRISGFDYFGTESYGCI